MGKDAVVIEADAIKNRDVMFKHLSSSDFSRNDPTLSSYVHEYSTKAAEMMLAAAGGGAPPAASSHVTCMWSCAAGLALVRMPHTDHTGSNETE